MTPTTKKEIREEWSKEVDNEMPPVFVIDAEKEIADWWLSKCCILEEEAYNRGYEDGKNNILRVSS